MSQADKDLLEHVLLPVPEAETARETARQLEPYRPERVTALYVIEKAENAPSKTPVSKSGEIGADAFAAVRDVFPDIDMETEYSDDVVEMIDETADRVGATAVVYTPRGGNRLIQYLAGDKSLRLLTETSHPVVALPTVDE